MKLVNAFFKFPFYKIDPTRFQSMVKKKGLNLWIIFFSPPCKALREFVTPPLMNAEQGFF